jgi:peptide/nickel transport system substrate-binding protein
VRVIGERRIEVRALRPDPTLLARLAWGFVLPADDLGKSPVPVLGAAPYTLERWTPDAGFSFVRNPNYWGTPAAYKRAEFPGGARTTRPTARARREGRGRSRGLRPSRGLGPTAAEPWAARGGGRRAPRAVLRLRVDRPPFSDPRVREAFDLAIDRRAIVEKVLFGKGSAANQLLPRAAVGHVPTLPPSRPRSGASEGAAASRGLLARHRLRLDGPSNRYVRDVEIMREVARQLEDVGLQVEVNALEKRAFYTLLAGGRSDFYLLGWASESGDGADTFEVLFPSPDSPGASTFNASGFYDARLDEISARRQSTTNLQARAAVLQRAFTRLSELRPILPLVVQPEAVVYNPQRVRWDPAREPRPAPGDLRPADARP